jgi:hypothetical protein
MGRVVQEGDPGALTAGGALADRGAGGADRPRPRAPARWLALALSSLFAASVVVPGGHWYAHYRKFLGDDLYVAYIYRSFRVAAYTTVCAVIVGYAIAYVMTRVSPATRRLIVMLLDPAVLLGQRHADLFDHPAARQQRRRQSDAARHRRDRFPVRLIYNELGVVIGPRQRIASVRRVSDPQRAGAHSGIAARGGAHARRTAQPHVLADRVPVEPARRGRERGDRISSTASAPSPRPLMLGGGFVDLISVFSSSRRSISRITASPAAGAIVTSALGLLPCTVSPCCSSGG